MNDFDILRLDEASRKEQVKKDLEQISRPSLMRRIGSGLLDLVFIFVLFVLVELIAMGVFFRPLGYFDAKNDIDNVFIESGLYLRQNGLNVTITNAYDETKTVEQNYDLPITNYYTNDQRCIENDMFSQYEQSKLNSGYFVKDEVGNIVVKSDVSQENLKEFFQQEYTNALAFLRKNATYVEAVNKTFNIMVYSILIALLISVAVFYFAIPLLRKNGETLGQIICKICLMDVTKIGQVGKMQVLVRSLVVVVLNFLIPFWIFVFFGNVSTLTILISFAVTCLTKYNQGIHDFLSKTQVVMKFESFRWAKRHENEGNK